MKKKRLVKSLLAVAVAIGMLAVIGGCADVVDETTTPEESTDVTTPSESETDVGVSITDGVFIFEIIHEGTDYSNLLNFYENGVFYFARHGGAQAQAGYYTVEEGSFEIVSIGSVHGEEDHEETIECDYKVTFYDMDAQTVIGESGYIPGESLIGFSLHNRYDYKQDLESDHSPEDEIGITLAEYFVEDDEYSLISLRHNGTFNDTVVAFISGTWTREGDVYTLTNEETGETYTLTDNSDGSATYVGEDGEEITLYAIEEAEVSLSFSGSVEATYGEMEIILNAYDDDTARMTIKYAGSENFRDGTWEMAADYSNITFTLNGEEYVAPIDPEEHTFSLEFVTDDGVEDVTVLLTQVE